MEIYTENNYGNDFITDDIEKKWNEYSMDESLEEKYFLPQNKFIKLVHFDIMADQIKDYNPAEFEKKPQDEVLLALMNHPYGDSKWLDKAYEILYRAIDAKHRTDVDSAKQRAMDIFGEAIKFQLEKRQECCPVCFGEEFETCTHFYKCGTCRGGVCADCGPLIPNKCPICNVKKPMNIVSLNKIRQTEYQSISPKKTVRQLLSEIMYEAKPGSTQKVNLFGQSIQGYEKFNLSSLSPEEFDYELAEFLRLCRDLLQSKHYDEESSDYEALESTDLWWSKGLVPYLMGERPL